MHVSRNEEFQRRKGTSELVSGNIRSLLLIGATCSVGVFVRFTFIFFAFPVVALFLWTRWERLGYRLGNIVCDGFLLAVSFLVISSAFIMVDTQYYSRQAEFTCAKFGCMLNYIAPFNAFRYNSNRSNLAKHGLHPRVTHLGELIMLSYDYFTSTYSI
jgi:phosphatidylinositol glycan class Z